MTPTLPADPEAVIDAVVADLTRGHDDLAYYWHVQGWRIRETLRLIRKHAPPAARPRVLDIGCNPSFVIASLARFGYACTGVDLHPETMTDVAARYGLTTHRVDVEAEPLPFPDNRFDLVILTEVFEHLRIDPIRTVAELYRVLAPGGVFVLSTPNLRSLNGIYKFLVKGTAYSCANDSVYDQFDMVHKIGVFGHMREYTAAEVTGFLARIGFGPMTTYYHGGSTKYGVLGPVYRLFPSLRPGMHVIAVKPAAGSDNVAVAGRKPETVVAVSTQ